MTTNICIEFLKCNRTASIIQNSWWNVALDNDDEKWPIKLRGC